jgi:DNA polymerase III delta prime subunit
MPKTRSIPKIRSIDKIKCFLLSEISDLDQQLSENIISELSKRYGLPSNNNARRKKIFKGIFYFLEKLETLEIKITTWLNNNLAHHASVKANPKAYSARAAAKLERFFGEDYKIYMNEYESTVKEALFSEKTDAVLLRSQMQTQVIGQAHAIDLIVNALNKKRNSRENNIKPRVFLFCGPTGVGKTELAKAMAATSFKDDNSKECFISIPMETYSADNSHTRLFGSSPGYVGSQDKPAFAKSIDPFVVEEEGGTKTVKDMLILFDEFEKADAKVKQSLLGLFDEGRMPVTYTENEKNVNITYIFYGCFFVCTVNLFSHEITQDFEKIDGIAESNDIDNIIDNFKKRLNSCEKLSPEMAGRMSIVPFGPLKKGNEFQKLLEITLIKILGEIKINHRLSKAEIDVQDKARILEAFEGQYYKNGTDIRSTIRDIEIVFDSLLAKFNFGNKKSYFSVVLKFDEYTSRVIMNISWYHLNKMQFACTDKKDGKFFLTKLYNEQKTSAIAATRRGFFAHEDYQSLRLWASFLLGMISLGIVIWNRESVHQTVPVFNFANH